VYTSVIDDVTLLTSYVSVDVTVGDNVKLSILKFFMKPILFFEKFEFNNYFSTQASVFVEKILSSSYSALTSQVLMTL
jgi:hypothetical protein